MLTSIKTHSERGKFALLHHNEKELHLPNVPERAILEMTQSDPWAKLPEVSAFAIGTASHFEGNLKSVSRPALLGRRLCSRNAWTKASPEIGQSQVLADLCSCFPFKLGVSWPERLILLTYDKLAGFFGRIIDN